MKHPTIPVYMLAPLLVLLALLTINVAALSLPDRRAGSP